MRWSVKPACQIAVFTFSFSRAIREATFDELRRFFQRDFGGGRDDGVKVSGIITNS